MIALIAAVARNGTIGKDGKIPWRLPEDLKRFKQLTMGHVLVMGRKTFESIGGPLPGRHTIMLTKSIDAASRAVWGLRRDFHATGSLDMALKFGGMMKRADDAVLVPVPMMVDGAMTLVQPLRKPIIFICGGAEVYREALESDVVDRQYLTAIDADFDGDTFMPPCPDNVPGVPGLARWEETFSERHRDEKPPYDFLIHDRRRDLASWSFSRNTRTR